MSARADFYREWRDLMRSWGFTVLEAAGWETRDAEPRTSYDPAQLYVEHHDASTPLAGNWGALPYILANRLANIVTARDGTIMLCAAGVAWHAGVGSYPGIPTNGANPRSMGDEVANSGSEPYSDACTRSIIAGEAAWTVVAKRRQDRVIGHKEWAKPDGRKQDPRIDMNTRRADVAAFNPQEDDMALTGDEIESIADRTTAKLATAANPWGLDALLQRIMSLQSRQIATERALRAADENDSPEVLAREMAPVLIPAFVPLAVAAIKEELGDAGAALDEERATAIAKAVLEQMLDGLDRVS